MAHPSARQYAQWPANPLDAARRAFAWLSAGDHPVTLDGRLFEYLSDREIPVDELRDLLLRRSCPRRVWDQVWTHVILRSRHEGGTWTIVAVGLALPMLTAMAARLTDRYADDPTDIHAEVLRGFLEALHSLDLPRGRIAIRLRWAAYRAGHRALTISMDGPTPKPPEFRAAEPKPPSGHPDVVLARAVAVGVLTQAEAEVIGATRLDGIALTEWPRDPDWSYNKLRKFRSRAEHRLAAWLASSAETSEERAPTGQAAMTETSPDASTDTSPRSRTVVKVANRAVADRPAESGLQDRR